MKKATIKDVARKAGVALSTVSNALNNSPLVTPETREKVMEAARQLNYVPNVNGRLLKCGRSKRLCFITASIRGGYFVRLLDALNEECVRKGYSLEIVVTWDRTVIMNRILGGGFDGFFLFEEELVKEEEIEVLRREGITVVMLDREYNDEKMSSVIFDSYRAGYQITKHLINLGHRHFGFMDTYADNYDGSERKRGFLDALKREGIEVLEEDMMQGYFDENAAFSAMMGRMRLRGSALPTAVVCSNDRSAVGTIKALLQAGIRVPETVSVVGFDDIEIAQYFRPSITTVRNPVAEQGRSAVQTMVGMLEEAQSGSIRVLEGMIVARESSGICQV